MEPEGLLPRLQAPPTYPYLQIKSIQPMPHRPTSWTYIFCIILPSTPGKFDTREFNLCTHDTDLTEKYL
jgi:hypothetical protein